MGKLSARPTPNTCRRTARRLGAEKGVVGLLSRSWVSFMLVSLSRWVFDGWCARLSCRGPSLVVQKLVVGVPAVVGRIQVRLVHEVQRRTDLQSQWQVGVGDERTAE